MSKVCCNESIHNRSMTVSRVLDFAAASLQSHYNPVFEKVYLFMLEETPHIRDLEVSSKRLAANSPGSHLLLGCNS